MPPTFLYFIGAIIYVLGVIITTVICVPILLFNKSNKFAKRCLVIVLTSFPSLLAMSIVWTLVGLPVIGIILLCDSLNIPKTTQAIFTIPCLLIYIGLLIYSSIYVWRLATNVILAHLNHKSGKQVLYSDRRFIILLSKLKKLKGLIKI